MVRGMRHCSQQVPPSASLREPASDRDMSQRTAPNHKPSTEAAKKVVEMQEQVTPEISLGHSDPSIRGLAVPKVNVVQISKANWPFIYRCGTCGQEVMAATTSPRHTRPKTKPNCAMSYSWMFASCIRRAARLTSRTTKLPYSRRERPRKLPTTWVNLCTSSGAQ